MATFRVGQRVRIVGARFSNDLIGRTAVIVAIPDRSRLADLLVDGYDPRDFGWDVATVALTDWSHIVPLTDPRADEFIETVKSWGPLKEQPKTPEEVLAEIIKEAK